MWNPPKIKKGEGFVMMGHFYEGHSTNGYAHLGISFINKENAKQENELFDFFLRIEAMKTKN